MNSGYSCHFLFLLHILAYKNGSGPAVQRRNEDPVAPAQAIPYPTQEVGSRGAVETPCTYSKRPLSQPREESGRLSPQLLGESGLRLSSDTSV